MMISVFYFTRNHRISDIRALSCSDSLPVNVV